MLSLLGSLATGTLHGQHASVGVKAGLNASTYHGSDVPSPQFRLGPMAGVLVRLPLGVHLDLQPELFYEQRGARTSYTTTLTGISSSYEFTHQEFSRLHYASLPVLVRLHGAKWFAVAGPQVSYLLAAQRRITNASELISGPRDPSILVSNGTTTTRSVSSYNRWELGYVVGVGYQVASRLGIELRYAAGLTSVRRSLLYETYQSTPRAELARNGSLQAQVSYQFSAQ
ncbi:porin family protein [uncultured Hymenobacter sp.]|uniref:porin family protein n=1 Tax=uncultured Hymenobacter sp. TaxID=170016 RepID=UPI0035CC7088